MILLILSYIGLFFSPQVLFSKKTIYKSFVIYSHDPLDQRINAILDSAESLLSKSEFYNKTNFSQSVFLCNGYKEFMVWAFLSRKAFAINQDFTNNIFIAKADISTNTAKRNAEEYNTRSLSGVIAHETTHTLLRKYFKYKSLSRWEQEGYCDFIAHESSFPTTAGINDLCYDLSESSKSFDYFKYRLYVDYLMNDEHLTFKQIAEKDFSVP